MAYTQEMYLGMLDTTHRVDLTAAAVHGQSVYAPCKLFVHRLQMHVRTATVSTGNIVVAFKKRVTPGSAVGEVTLGSITIPTGVAAGTVYYKDISAVNFVVGDELVVEVTTAAAGGGAAGAAVFSVCAYEDPEVPANMSDMVASA